MAGLIIPALPGDGLGDLMVEGTADQEPDEERNAEDGERDIRGWEI